MSAYSYLLVPADKSSQNEEVISVHTKLYRKKIENNNKNFELVKTFTKEHS